MDRVEGWDMGRGTSRRPRASIRTRIVRTTVVLALVPLVVLGAVVLVSVQRLSSSTGASVEASRSALRDQVVTAGLERSAQDISDHLDRYLLERVRDVRVWATDPLVRVSAAQATQDAERQGVRGRGTEELENRFRANPSLGSVGAAEYLATQLAGSNGAFAELFFTEANGYTVAFSSRTTDFVQSDEIWWQNAWAKGFDIGLVAYDESARAYATEIAVRINDGAGTGLGVFKAVLNISAVQSIADARSPAHNVTIINERGLILAETATRHDPGRIMSESVVFPAVVGQDVAPVVDLARGRGTGSVITGDRAWGAVRTGRTQQPVDGFAGFGWVVLVDQPTEVAFAPLTSVDQVRSSVDGVANLLRVVVLLAVLAVGVIAFAVAGPLAQRVVQPILRLRDAADDIATTRLPELVETMDRLEVGEELPSLAPIDVRTGDEVEELADAFNSVVATAGRLAGEQVEHRRHNLSATFISMGRRNQKLLGRQLKVLDELERNESDPDALEGLFKLDQLATRMRRNAESLLVLAGQPPARKWTERVPMHDVVRAAVSEIEAFNRIDAHSVEPAFLRGDVLAEVAHLLAELCENATAFSPPDATVEVIGRVRDPGYRISIVDRGIGLSEEELAQANEKLKHPDGFDRVPSQYLGLFVVGRLANRLGIEVHLFESAGGGLIARVTLPPSLLDGAPPDDRGEAAGTVTDAAEVDAGDDAATGDETGGGAPAVPVPSWPATPDEDAGSPALPARRRGAGVAEPAAAVDAFRVGRSKRPSDWLEADGEEVQPSTPVEVTASGFKVRQRPGQPVTPVRPIRAPVAPVAPVAPAAPTQAAEQARATLSSFMTGVERGRRDAQAAPVADPRPVPEDDQA